MLGVFYTEREKKRELSKCSLTRLKREREIELVIGNKEISRDKKGGTKQLYKSHREILSFSFMFVCLSIAFRECQKAPVLTRHLVVNTCRLAFQ